jgi:hypothetical protein
LNPLSRREYFGTICGSNSPLRSRGTLTGTAPMSVSLVLVVDPPEVVPRAAPARIALLVAQVLGQLNVQGPVEHSLGQLGE